MVIIGDTRWEELKVEGENQLEAHSHVESVLLGNKLLLLNFDQFDRSGEIKILEINGKRSFGVFPNSLDESKTASWMSAEIKGDLVKSSQFYTIVATSNPANFLIMDLTNKCKVTILNLGSILIIFHSQVSQKCWM
jgi:hypothetical protein